MSDRPDFEKMNCPLPLTLHTTVQLAHGAGGRLSDELIDRLIRPRFANPELDRQEDQAVLEVPAGRLSFSTDTFVVSPLEFPGGDIGDLAVNGTVNDVAMAGAAPMALSVGLVLEEGLEIAVLERILDSMAKAAREAGVKLVTGDTKVVDKGSCDRMFINTSGVGMVRPGVALGAGHADHVHPRPHADGTAERYPRDAPDGDTGAVGSLLAPGHDDDAGDAGRGAGSVGGLSLAERLVDGHLHAGRRDAGHDQRDRLPAGVRSADADRRQLAGHGRQHGRGLAGLRAADRVLAGGEERQD